jgi:hypothetical protein
LRRMVFGQGGLQGCRRVLPDQRHLCLHRRRCSIGALELRPQPADDPFLFLLETFPVQAARRARIS